MVYGIIPRNFFSPFTEGNVLQIIFVAVIFGIAMLVLAGRVPQAVVEVADSLKMLDKDILRKK